MIAGLCVTYLGGAMRFDFRAELDRMVWIKAWPVAPAHVFVAMLAPQVLLTTLLVGVALWLRLAVLRSDDPFAWAVPLLLFWALRGRQGDRKSSIFERRLNRQRAILQEAGRSFSL